MGAGFSACWLLASFKLLLIEWILNALLTLQPDVEWLGAEK
jgi:hypothetical protein